MTRLLALALAASIAGAPAAHACHGAVFGRHTSLLGELHGAPYGETPFWCEIFIGANGVITTKTCDPLRTQSGGVATITLSGRLTLDPACALSGYVDAGFNTAIQRRYTVKGRVGAMFIAVGTNGPANAPLSVMSLSAVNFH